MASLALLVGEHLIGECYLYDHGQKQLFSFVTGFQVCVVASW